MKKEILSQINELEAGIIPFFVWFKNSDSKIKLGINPDRWQGLSDEESSKMRRKFRKIFRKACKKYGIEPNNPKPTPKFKYKIVQRYLSEILGD